VCPTWPILASGPLPNNPIMHCPDDVRRVTRELDLGRMDLKTSAYPAQSFVSSVRQ